MYTYMYWSTLHLRRCSNYIRSCRGLLPPLLATTAHIIIHFARITACACQPSFHMVRIGRRTSAPERVRGACIISSFLTSRSPPTNGKAKSVSRLAMRARTRSMLAFFFCQHRRTVPQSNTAVTRRSTSTLIFSLLCSFLRGVLCAPATCSHAVWHPARTSSLASMAALP